MVNEYPHFIGFDHIGNGQSVNYALGSGAFDSFDDCTITDISSRRRLRMIRDVFGGGSFTINMPTPTDDRIVCGFRYQSNSTDAGGAIWGFRDGSTDMFLLSTSSGILLVTHFGSTGIQIQDGTERYIEVAWYPHNTLGEYEVRIDGVTVASGSGVDTILGGTTFDNIEATRGGGSTGAYHSYCDIYFKEWEDSSTPGFFNPIRLYLMNPDSDISVDFTPTPGAGEDNYEDVDETPIDDDTSYVESAAPGDVDEYGIESVPGGVESIIAMVRGTVAKLSGAGASNIEHGFDLGADQDYGPTHPLTSAYRTQLSTFMLQPDASPWNVADANTLNSLDRSA